MSQPFDREEGELEGGKQRLLLAVNASFRY